MLLFENVLYYSLHLTSSANISIFSVSLLEPQLQLEIPKLETSSRSVLLLVLVYCNCLFFPVLSIQSFCPRHSNINKVTHFFSFVQHNYVRPSMLNDMICLDIKIPQYFDPGILNYTCRFVILPLNLANSAKLLA